MIKKKQEIVIRMNDLEQLSKYMNTEYNKLVVINVFDKFWGPCEVADNMVKRFLEQADYNNKVDFICIDKGLAGELFTKYEFASKPKFFICHKGNIAMMVDGLDFPRLSEEVEKCFPMLEA